jgi:PAS domain S-box-containing protein
MPSDSASAKVQRTFAKKLPSGKVVVTTYCVVLTAMGALIVFDRSLDFLWVLMMIPVVTAALFYPRRVYLLMLGYLLVSSIGVILLEPVKASNGIQLTIAFVLGTGALAEGLYRLMSVRNQGQEALRRAKDELEERVAERTVELRKTINELEEQIQERKRVEEALRQSEERFSKAFQATSVPMAITEIDDGRVIDVNGSFSRLVGYSLKEVIGQSTLDMNVWAYPEQRTKMVEILRERGSVHEIEMKLRTRRGQIRDVLFSGEIINVGEQQYLMASAMDVTERQAQEKQLREYAESQTMLLNQLLRAQEAERRRLSMEIHDGPLQSLGVSLMALDRAMRRRQRGEEELADQELRSLRDTLAGTVAELRSVLADLSLEILGTYGLGSALRSHVDRFSNVTGVNVTLKNTMERRLAPEVELLIYRLAQEALANIRKHAHAEHANIALEIREEKLHLKISDDGKGFNVREALSQRQDGERIGLRSMRQRVRAIRGDLTITSAPGKGTTLEFWCPIPEGEITLPRLDAALLATGPLGASSIGVSANN